MSIWDKFLWVNIFDWIKELFSKKDKRYELDVGVSIWGKIPTYSNLFDSILEFKTFIETNSKFKLNLIITNHAPLYKSELYMSGYCGFPDRTKLSSYTTSVLTHRINIMLYDILDVMPTIAGGAWIWSLNGNSLCVVPYGEKISWWTKDATWTYSKSSALVHEFIHGIDINSDNCPSLGYNNGDGWKSCYIHLLSKLTDKDYKKICGI